VNFAFGDDAICSGYKALRSYYGFTPECAETQQRRHADIRRGRGIDRARLLRPRF